MSRKHFSWLLFATFMIGAAVLVLPEQTGREDAPGSGLLLPGLEDQVNELTWLRLTSAGGQTVVTLQRAADTWTVDEASGYQADWEALRGLLSGLARARVIEPKTANPAYYERLGVEDVSLETAGGILIEFAEDSGLPAVIVGNSARGRSGQYVRLASSATSALVDVVLEVPAERSSWLESSIVDISDGEVVEVEITHPDGEGIEAIKASAEDENFLLSGIPEGMEIKSNWTIDALAGGLADLSLEDVSPEDRFDWQGAIQLDLLTADGVLLEAELIEQLAGGEESGAPGFWIRLQAGIYTTALETATGSPETEQETRQRAEAINQRTRGWAYRIPQYKYDAMTKRMEDLLQASPES